MPGNTPQLPAGADRPVGYRQCLHPESHGLLSGKAGSSMVRAFVSAVDWVRFVRVSWVHFRPPAPLCPRANAGAGRRPKRCALT